MVFLYACFFTIPIVMLIFYANIMRNPTPIILSKQIFYIEVLSSFIEIYIDIVMAFRIHSRVIM